MNKKIEEKFSFGFKKAIKFLPNIFKNSASQVKKIATLREFDLFFYVTDGSYFLSSAAKNYIFCMYPKKNLYKMNFINKLKTLNYKYISNSSFTQKWLNKWKIKSEILPLYISEDLLKIKFALLRKEKIILTVGRFFDYLHSKQQSRIINTFNKFSQKNSEFKKFKLILAGGLRKKDKNYFNSLKKLAATNTSVIFKPNLPHSELIRLYKKSQIFWHFTGFGVDENIHPESVEHFGIAPIEAMAAGCLAFCFASGGPKEYIQEGKNGFLFKTEKELREKLYTVIRNHPLQKKVQKEAKIFIDSNFSYEIFSNRLKKILS